MSRASDRGSRTAGPFASTVRTEAGRLQRDHPEAWAEGGKLLEDVGRTLQVG